MKNLLEKNPNMHLTPMWRVATLLLLAASLASPAEIVDSFDNELISHEKKAGVEAGGNKGSPADEVSLLEANGEILTPTSPPVYWRDDAPSGEHFLGSSSGGEEPVTRVNEDEVFEGEEPTYPIPPEIAERQRQGKCLYSRFKQKSNKEFE